MILPWRAEKHRRCDLWLVGFDGPNGFVTLASMLTEEEAKLIADAPRMRDELCRIIPTWFHSGKAS